ncbi:Protein CBG08703 [Caenorhabditis briggsae]|uniref:Carboxylic ester hydrolase n=1 Tax=Caenorhabditis briggsae TaxID=6238 RepID=A8X6S0_CAEBR|nr:Protein CBG08703 [Caenorhabditis briggsae]CAP28331.2 Protein CBG08703 [Caenorhabditis briggsae]
MGGFLSHLKPENNKEVFNSSCGPIRGNIYRHGEKIVDGYLGVPFAKAPIGELQYKKPVPADKWTEPIDCYKYGPGCPQSGSFAAVSYGMIFFYSNFTRFQFFKGVREFAEDNCLNLNVFSPRTKPTEFVCFCFEKFLITKYFFQSKGLPVMVYFYGGGFEVGFSSMLDDYSLSGTLPLKDVVVVSANYRVGPLGFLTTGDEVSKGNYGLWDQTLALKWVQDHIASFGGDPDNVTIFGTSAGGASVDFLALSPHSNKMFHRFMANSGSAFCDFAIRPKHLQAKVFREFAKHFGYNGEDSQSLLKWYQNQETEKFTEVENFKRPASGFLSFVPNLDGDFFPKPLDELRKEAPKLDVIVTVGEYEGLSFMMNVPKGQPFNETVSLLFGEDMVNDVEENKKKLVELYMKDVDTTDKDAVMKRTVEFVGDAWFNIGILNTAKSCAKYGNNVYLASFDYYCKDGIDPPMAATLAFKAATHGSELKFIVGEGMGKFSPTEEELKVMDIMGTTVTNFAKYGNPNGKNVPEIWKKYNVDHPDRYFKIDYPKSEMRDNFQNGRLKALDEVNKSGKKYQEIVYGNKL